jgi:hypothetical protein
MKLFKVLIIPPHFERGDRVLASDGILWSDEWKVDRVTPEGVWVMALPGTQAFTHRTARTGSNSPFIPDHIEKL